MKDLSITVLFDYYGDCLSDKQRELFDFYYNEDYSLAEVAQNVGISRQGVRDSVKRTEQQLREFESKLRLCEKTNDLKAVADEFKKGNASLEQLLDFIDNF
ncbi:MAG: sigma factor-like helix-turn-helix DNA-binding protein [Acutalibacteraceae bacterium]|nr:sigma factor-like helix-turn-helix DNA-binding protein [Acutalibacteraceae bacterium]